MDTGIISTRYAKALLLYATDNCEEEQVYKEMTVLANSFIAVPKLHDALINPTLSSNKKATLLTTAACGKDKPSASLTKFLLLVMKKNRADIMQLVANAFGTLYRAEKHIIRGKLVMPTAVKAEVIEKLKAMVEKKSQQTVDFQIVEDPSIGGGFIMEYDTYRFDASVRTQLAKLKRELH